MTKNKDFIQARIDSIVASSTIMVHDDDDDDDVERKDRNQRILISGRKVPRYRVHPSKTHMFHEVKKDHRHTEPMYRRNEDYTVDFNSCHCIISGSDGPNISKKNSEKHKPNMQSTYEEATNQHQEGFDKKKLTTAMKLQHESELVDEEIGPEVDEYLAEPVIDVKLKAKPKKKKNLALGVDGDNDIHEHKSKAFRRNASAIVACLLVVVIICICILFTIGRPRKTPLG